MTENFALHNLLTLSDTVIAFIKSLHTNQLRGIPGLWEIQTSRQNVRSKLELTLPQITDTKLHNLFYTLSSQEERLFEMDNQLLEVVADFLGISVPKSELEFMQLREEIKKHVRANGESKWLVTAPYERLLRKAHDLYLRVEGVGAQIRLHVQQLTSPNAIDQLAETVDYMPSSKAIRDKDKLRREIQSARDDSDIERGIRKLHRILDRQKLTGSDAVWVYEALSAKYWTLGDLQQAIDFLTKAIETGQPFGLLYFWRGQLYYQRQQWIEAKDDLEMALAEGLSSPEQEEAKRYLTGMDNTN
jgi:tetratricopeptide (TPR) repeat protein